MLRKLLCDLLEALTRIERSITPPVRLPNRDVSVPVGASVGVQQLYVQGRHYNYLFAPAAVAVSLNVPGAGINIAYNLSQGWNPVHLPDGTEIFSTAAGITNLIYRASDDPYGGVI